MGVNDPAQAVSLPRLFSSNQIWSCQVCCLSTRWNSLLIVLLMFYLWPEGEHYRSIGISEFVRMSMSFFFNAWPFQKDSWKSLLAATCAVYSPREEEAYESIIWDLFLRRGGGLWFTYCRLSLPDITVLIGSWFIKQPCSDFCMTILVCLYK